MKKSLLIGSGFALLLGLAACGSSERILAGADLASDRVNAAEDEAVARGVERFCNGDIDMMVRYVNEKDTVDWKVIAAFCPETYGEFLKAVAAEKSAQ